MIFGLIFILAFSYSPKREFNFESTTAHWTNCSLMTLQTIGDTSKTALHENLMDSACLNPCVFPVAIDSSLVITSHYGKRTHPVHGNKTFHHGIDIISHYALATHSGRIEIGYQENGYGKYAVLYGKDINAIYAHLDSIYPAHNSTIEVLDTIGIIGNTGNSTGRHLHYELNYKDSSIDPLQYYSLTNH